MKKLIFDTPERVCYTCKVMKPFSAYHKDATTSSGVRGICKECINIHRMKECAVEKRRKWRDNNRKHLRAGALLHSFKEVGIHITREDYTTMMKQAGDTCPICNNKYTSTPSIDHCHDTLKIRGVICNTCNAGIGFLKHSKEIFQKAIDYIEDFEQNDRYSKYVSSGKAVTNCKNRRIKRSKDGVDFIFNSLTEASRSIGCRGSVISRAIISNTQVKGYYWTDLERPKVISSYISLIPDFTSDNYINTQYL